MKAIYEPKGAALEYAPLAVNLFRGCPHACRYCYCPGVLRMDRESFHRDVAVRPGILAAIERDATTLEAAGDRRRIHLCFTCDPFPATRPDLYKTTIAALTSIGQHRLPAAVLTKGLIPPAFLLDLAGMDLKVGVSLVWGTDAMREAWEPGTASISDRLATLRAAKAAGFTTFVSVEPVVDPEEALAAMYLVSSLADDIRVGKLNHMDTPNPVDWKAFANEARRGLVEWSGLERDKGWMIKSSLIPFLEVAP